MSKEGKLYHKRIKIADHIPRSKWSDAREEYFSTEKTADQIAMEQGCVARTVSRLIKENRNFSELGKKRTPSKVDGYQDVIEKLLKSNEFKGMLGLTSVSSLLHKDIVPLGFTGCERTLRTYIETLPWEEWVTKE